MHVMRGQDYHYYAVSSATYMKALADKCAKANVRFINGTVMKTSIHENYTRMLMRDEQTVTAHHVFDTVNYITPYDCMKQHFLGQHIKVSKNTFNSGSGYVDGLSCVSGRRHTLYVCFNRKESLY